MAGIYLFARALQGCRGVRPELCRGHTRTVDTARDFRLLVLLAFFVGSCSICMASREIRDPALYCPSVPAVGQLSFKSVDSQNSLCTPSVHDDMGLAVYTCWRSFTIEINGCEVRMRPDETQVVGPGRLPCRFFSISGNLTGTGVEAQMWVTVDGPALLSYYASDPQAVEALRYDNPRHLVRDLWAFLRDFTADLRFDDNSWIDSVNAEDAPGGFSSDSSDPGSSSSGSSAQEGEERDTLFDPDSEQDKEEQGQARWREGEEKEQNELGGGFIGRSRGRDSDSSTGGGSSGGGRRGRHGPMRVYRPSESRVVLKVLTGCKYRYTVNADSHVFESPAQQHTHVQWRTIGITVALLSCVMAVVGLGVCTYFSHKHAEYVASYWEYQAVKDHLGSELPPSTYQRLFGEPPKTAAAAAAAAAAATEAARSQRRYSATTPGGQNPVGAAGAPVLSPAVQQHAAADMQPEAGEAPVIGAGEPDGISSRSSSADGGEVAAAADDVLAVAVEEAPPVLLPAASEEAGKKGGRGGKGRR